MKKGQSPSRENWKARRTRQNGLWTLFFMDSVFRALWLAAQSVNIQHYSLIHLQFLRASDGDAKLA